MTHKQPSSQTPGGEVHVMISHRWLVLQQDGDQHQYTWFHHPPQTSAQIRAALLINLDDIRVPASELDKIIHSILAPSAGVIAIAFANCHARNQQELKRKLKAGDVKLYSKTTFFRSIDQARQWLEAQCAKALCPGG